MLRESSAVVGASSAQGKTSGDNTEEPMEPENKHLLSAIKLTASDNSNSHSPLSGPVSAGSTVFSPSDGLAVGRMTTPPISDELMQQVLTGKKTKRNSSNAKREIAVSLDSVASEDGLQNQKRRLI